MYFKDIIGQADILKRMVDEARSGKMPHARLLCGPSGRGGLPMAVALARYLMCSNPGCDDACGQCADCKMMDAWAHPDVHFVFPVVKRKGKDTVSDDLMTEWRTMMAKNPYATPTHWLEAMGADNGQPQIYVKESDVMLRKLSLKPARGGKKVMIVWLPEKMNADCSNKLLKILEEPPYGTILLLVTEEPDVLLPTLRSRTQRMDVPPVKENAMLAELMNRYGVDPNDAEAIVRHSGGDWAEAMQALRTDGDKAECLELFVSLMRLAYARRIREMRQWSETVAAMGRERQKRFLAYAQRMVRENFVCNFGQPEMIGLDSDEQAFAKRFAPFVNENNIMGIAHELAEAEIHIARNVNPRMVFFDLALKMIVLLVKN